MAAATTTLGDHETFRGSTEFDAVSRRYRRGNSDLHSAFTSTL